MIPSAQYGQCNVQRRRLSRVGYITGAFLGCAVVLAAFVPAGAAQIPQSAAATDQQEAVSTFKALQRNLYQSSPELYSGSPTNTCGSYSCLWPFTNATAGTVFLYGTPGGSRYMKKVAARLVGLGHYADATEISPSGMPQPPAYQSAVAPPLGPGGSTYYDDNGWVGLDLVHAYHLTSNSADLTLAQDEFNFAISGWDTSTTDGCPGGVFWEDVAGSQRNATANGANAELGLELSRLTGDSSDLTWATRMYQWVVTCLGTPGGLYDDHVNSDGSVNTTIWSYNQGVMVGAGVLLYHTTGNGRLSDPSRTDGHGCGVVFRHGIDARQPRTPRSTPSTSATCSCSTKSHPMPSTAVTLRASRHTCGHNVRWAPGSSIPSTA